MSEILRLESVMRVNTSHTLRPFLCADDWRETRILFPRINGEREKLLLRDISPLLREIFYASLYGSLSLFLSPEDLEFTVPSNKNAAVTKCIFLSLSARDINLHNPRCSAHAILHLIEARISLYRGRIQNFIFSRHAS